MGTARTERMGLSATAATYLGHRVSVRRSTTSTWWPDLMASRQGPCFEAYCTSSIAVASGSLLQTVTGLRFLYTVTLQDAPFVPWASSALASSTNRSRNTFMSALSSSTSMSGSVRVPISLLSTMRISCLPRHGTTALFSPYPNLPLVTADYTGFLPFDWAWNGHG